VYVMMDAMRPSQDEGWPGDRSSCKWKAAAYVDVVMWKLRPAANGVPVDTHPHK
jgi:hypothetical protein